jgi:AraC-like DNA-binding protein
MPVQTYRERPPAAELEEHLSCVWVQQVAPDAGPYTHRTVPNGGVELVCELGMVPRLLGPQTGPTSERLSPGTTVVGVRFRPGAAPSVLGMPASEFVNLVVDSDELWGDAGALLGDEVARSASPDAAAAVLERAVLARLRRDRMQEPDPIVKETVRRLLPGRRRDVGAIASSLFISERQLRRRCVAAVGLPPKVLQRMLRFQGFLAMANARGGAGVDVAAAAAEIGYADQPHLTRESLRLSGMSPRVLLDFSEEHCRGVHDHSASYGPLLRSSGLPT